MTNSELAELLRRGEDSTLEFKRDDAQNHDLARELVALLNLAGGTVLLGVDDSGAIVGSTRDALDEDIRGPMVFLGSASGELTETGLVERALDFVRRNTETTAVLDRGRRINRREYPEAVIRELVVNALVHRDYSIAGADILLEIFGDRLEVTSPGKLPNTVTPEGMRRGLRYARNQTLVNVMRDYACMEARGMGMRNTIIPGMRAHNGTAPELIAEEHRFIVRLFKGPSERI